MLKILLHILVIAGTLLLLPRFIPGITVEGWYAALVVALLWGIIGVTLRPVLGILTLPINLITLGLFSFVLNALLFWLLATFVKGFAVAGFVPALEGSVVLAVVSWVLSAAL